MGVMPCYRFDCDEIMCDLYSSDYGYICSECFEELRNNPQDIGDFMASRKPKPIRLELHQREVDAEFGVIE